MTLIGFLILTALVIAMGTHSTARWEQEKQAATAPHQAPHLASHLAPRQAPARGTVTARTRRVAREAVGAAAVL